MGRLSSFPPLEFWRMEFFSCWFLVALLLPIVLSYHHFNWWSALVAFVGFLTMSRSYRRLLWLASQPSLTIRGDYSHWLLGHLWMIVVDFLVGFLAFPVSQRWLLCLASWPSPIVALIVFSWLWYVALIGFSQLGYVSRGFDALWLWYVALVFD